METIPFEFVSRMGKLYALYFILHLKLSMIVELEFWLSIPRLFLLAGETGYPTKLKPWCIYGEKVILSSIPYIICNGNGEGSIYFIIHLFKTKHGHSRNAIDNFLYPVTRNKMQLQLQLLVK